MKEAIVDNLINHSKRNITQQSQDDFGHRDLGQESLTKAHGVDYWDVTTRAQKRCEEKTMAWHKGSESE